MTPTSTSRLFAVVALATLAACSDNIPTTPMTEIESTESVGRGQPDRIEAAFRRSSPEVMGIPGTVFSDHDERIGKVVVGIENPRAEAAVRAAMARHGVAEGDYVIEATTPIHNMATLRDVVRPVVGGLQIHFTSYVCTIGFNATVNGQRSFITNSHCTGRQGGVESTVYYQSSSSLDPTVIATEVADPAYVKGGSCPKGKKCRYSDASRAAYSASVASTLGSIAATSGPNNGSLTIAGAVSISGTGDANVGAVVNKIGRTTGWTQGTVTRTCANTSVSGSQVYLYCQTFVSNPGGATVVGGGDSGSGVWSGSTGSATLVGLLWGGSSDGKQFVFSPLSQVAQEIGALTVR